MSQKEVKMKLVLKAECVRCEAILDVLEEQRRLAKLWEEKFLEHYNTCEERKK